MKHSNNGDMRFKFYNNFVQSLESPFVRDLVGNHIGDYISNPNNNLKKNYYARKRHWLIKIRNNIL